MKVEIRDNGVLHVSELPELSVTNAHAFRDRMNSVLTPEVRSVEIDLGDTGFVDICGLGALLSLHKTVINKWGGVPIRLLNPTSSVEFFIKMTLMMHRLFEITKR